MKITSLALSALLLAGTITTSTVIAAPVAQQKSKISKAEATNAVKAQLPTAKILSSELEKESGHTIWSFDLKDKGVLKEAWVDAYTGKVINMQTESKADQKKENRMDRAEAIVKKRTQGEVIGSTDQGKGKNEVYDFEVQKKDGTSEHVRVNARTLRILP